MRPVPSRGAGGATRPSKWQIREPPAGIQLCLVGHPAAASGAAACGRLGGMNLPPPDARPLADVGRQHPDRPAVLAGMCGDLPARLARLAVHCGPPFCISTAGIRCSMPRFCAIRAARPTPVTSPRLDAVRRLLQRDPRGEADAGDAIPRRRRLKPRHDAPHDAAGPVLWRGPDRVRPRTAHATLHVAVTGLCNEHHA